MGSERNFNYYAAQITHIPIIWVVYQLQLHWMSLETENHTALNCQRSNVVAVFRHGCSKNLIDLDGWIGRYLSILWHWLVGLNQKWFVNSADAKTLETITMEL